MRVCGIDVSSKSIDAIFVPLDPELEDGQIDYFRLELAGDSAIDRASRAAGAIPSGTVWDDVVRVVIERPYGPAVHSVIVAHLVIGAIIANLPERLRPPTLIQPRSWRKKNGLPITASKQDVRAHVIRTVPGISAALAQDTYDAICIARAARALEIQGTQETIPV